ncbi:MAG: hypothetical protein IPG90_17845 [Bacteroidetes bacterium]|nr:hypothetical protein [Bacteroidota bacterium]
MQPSIITRYGNFKPFVFKSKDGGMSWSPIRNLPERGSVYSIAEDHVNPDLLSRERSSVYFYK